MEHPYTKKSKKEFHTWEPCCRMQSMTTSFTYDLYTSENIHLPIQLHAKMLHLISPRASRMDQAIRLRFSALKQTLLQSSTLRHLTGSFLLHLKLKPLLFTCALTCVHSLYANTATVTTTGGK